MKTLLHTLFFFLLVTQICVAQVNWTKYPENPIFTGQSGTWYAYLSMNCVLYNADSSRYEMWFTAGAQASFPYNIGYAWSDDGISWNVHTANPVLTSTSGSWDAYMVFDPLVIRENGQYKMWYAGIETTALLTKIGYATSTDGINWIKHPDPVLLAGTASWESAAVSHPFVIPYSNGYKMWYSGSSAGASQTAFGYATSSDGINWQKDTLNNPVLLSGAIGQWDRVVYGTEILYIDNLYYMFYTGQNNLYQSDKVGLATSSDGIHNWNKHVSSPVLQPTPGQWDGSRTILGSVFMEDDTLKMYYAGSNGSNWEIGLATSSPFIPLPVELTSFTAEAEDQRVILKWTTATELNNNGFEIQRRVDESDFATVGFVKGEGTATNQKEYSYIDKDLVDGKYFYRLKQVDYNGTYEYSDVIEVDVRTLDEFFLEQNFPNPFNPTTTIGYVLKEKSNAKLILLNAIGEEVAVLINEEQEKGFHKVEFNAASLPSGVYFYQLKAGSFVETKKMLLLK